MSSPPKWTALRQQICPMLRGRVVGCLTRLEQRCKLTITRNVNFSVRPSPRLRQVLALTGGDFSFLASVTASETMRMTAALSLALRLEARAEALRSLKRLQ